MKKTRIKTKTEVIPSTEEWAHLRWSLIHHKGMTPKEADKRIEELKKTVEKNKNVQKDKNL